MTKDTKIIIKAMERCANGVISAIGTLSRGNQLGPCHQVDLDDIIMAAEAEDRKEKS